MGQGSQYRREWFRVFAATGVKEAKKGPRASYGCSSRGEQKSSNQAPRGTWAPGPLEFKDPKNSEVVMVKRRAYSGSKADPIRAQSRIRDVLRKFGVDRVGFDDDFKEGEVVIRFEYNNLRVAVPVNYGRLSLIYLQDDPWTSRKFKSEKEWIDDKRQVAYKAAFSVLEDFLKSMITMVETDTFTFEDVFLSYFTDSMGVRLGEVLAPRLLDFTEGNLALASGKDKG